MGRQQLRTQHFPYLHGYVSAVLCGCGGWCLSPLQWVSVCELDVCLTDVEVGVVYMW